MPALVHRRPFQSTTSAPKSMAASPNYSEAMSKERQRAAAQQGNLDATACIKELEISLAKGEIALEEYLAVSAKLQGHDAGEQKKAEAAAPSLAATRTKRMLEVTVSKIFPAGFGWQMASIYAGNAGLASTSVPFFLATGMGDCVGVFLGHTGFKAIQKAAGYEVNLKNETQTGLHLGSAAFMSGAAWQPTLNALQVLECTFNQAALGVGASCTLAFFVGLRLFRKVYSSLGWEAVEENNYENLKGDIGLSVSIGGATAAFVGTDVSYGAANWLAPVVGISENCPDALGQVIAGSSTALGFMATQHVQNNMLPEGKNWID